MTTNSKIKNIKCPDCGSNIDLDKLLVDKITESLNEEYQEKRMDLIRKEKEFNSKKQKENEIIANKLLKLKEEQKKTIYADIKAELEKENLQKIRSYQSELDLKSKQIQRFRGLEAELEKTKREVDEAYSVAVSKLSRQHIADLKIETQKAEERAKKDHELKIRELEKMLKNQKILTEEQKRKLDQGSQQLQGEVQEEAIEDWLKRKFPSDSIKEIRKGIRGADCLQIVNYRDEECGSIYYESKRTKNFDNKWISKFKKDLQQKNADIGVLVTDKYPSDLNRMGYKDGICICSYDEFKGLSFILRNEIIKINQVKVRGQNIGEKKELLYSYINSNEFKSNIENLTDAIKMMNYNLEEEKRKSIINFEKRKATYDLIMFNAAQIDGRFNGISNTKNHEENKVNDIIDEIPQIELLKKLADK